MSTVSTNAWINERRSAHEFSAHNFSNILVLSSSLNLAAELRQKLELHHGPIFLMAISLLIVLKYDSPVNRF